MNFPLTVYQKKCNNKLMKNDKPFELPESILNQLNETTLGFVLCYVDSQGNPQLSMQFDNFSFMLALQSTLKNWIEAHEIVNRDMNVNEIIGGCDCGKCDLENEED